LEAFEQSTEIVYVDDAAFNALPVNDLYLQNKLKQAQISESKPEDDGEDECKEQ
jgi:hypothetical protein